MDLINFRMKTNPSLSWFLYATLAVLASASAVSAEPAEQRLLNVSFGFTKDFFVDYNAWFAAKWKAETGHTVVIEQSHAASGTQTQSVIAGRLQPDVVTLAGPGDFDAIASSGLLAKDWRSEFPLGGSPYYSAVAFAVHTGNPKNIRDWADLTTPGLVLVTSNPKGCGGGLWNYTAAYAHGLHANGGDETKARAYVAAFYENVPVCYLNQGKSGEAFFKDKRGDVLITYESFLLGLKDRPQGAVAQAVYPARSVEIELPVAVLRTFTEKRGTTALAEAYLRGLYTPEAQELLAKHHFRPRVAEVAARVASRFPSIQLERGEAVFGSWARASKEHFDDKGLFDEVYRGEVTAAK